MSALFSEKEGFIAYTAERSYVQKRRLVENDEQPSYTERRTEQRGLHDDQCQGIRSI